MNRNRIKWKGSKNRHHTSCLVSLQLLYPGLRCTQTQPEQVQRRIISLKMERMHEAHSDSKGQSEREGTEMVSVICQPSQAGGGIRAVQEGMRTMNGCHVTALSRNRYREMEDVEGVEGFRLSQHCLHHLSLTSG